MRVWYLRCVNAGHFSYYFTDINLHHRASLICLIEHALIQHSLIYSPYTNHPEEPLFLKPDMKTRG